MFSSRSFTMPSGVHLPGRSGWFGEVADITPQGVRESCLWPTIVPLRGAGYRPIVASRTLGRGAPSRSDLARIAAGHCRAAQRPADSRLSETLGVADDRIRGVANRCGQPRELAVRKVEQALGIEIAYQVPDDPAEINVPPTRACRCHRTPPDKRVQEPDPPGYRGEGHARAAPAQRTPRAGARAARYGHKNTRDAKWRQR